MKTTVALVCVGLLAGSALAQRVPHIGYVCPAGGQRGTQFEVRLAGQYLGGVTNAFFTGPGVRARVVKYVRPLTGKQINLLRNRQKALQKALKEAPPNAARIRVPREGKTNQVDHLTRVAAQKEIREIRAKLANPKNRNRKNKQLAEDVVLQVTVDADAPPGPRELRLRATLGLSNPVAFHVGTLPEFQETEPNEQIIQAPRLPALPVVVNGQIMPGDVDRFRVRLNRGTHLVVAAQARALIPYLADAVPGWFQATLALYDRNGNELAYDDDFLFHPDPVLYYEIPRTDEYVLEIKDSIYRGREDFVYRLTVGELPFVTGIFPLGGPVGQSTEVELEGWNLPRERLTVNAAAASPGIRELEVRAGKAISNRFPFRLDTLPETREQEPNDFPADTGGLALPVIVNGQIDHPGDVDCFRIQGPPGAPLVAEVMARRLNSPLDSLLEITDARGKLLGRNDDHDDQGAALTTHQADSYLRVTLPQDGVCQVRLRDTQRQGGPAYAYRLRLNRPRPDFALRVTPSTVNLRPGATVPLTIHALRRDGFTNGIAIRLESAPEGFTLNRGKGGWLAPGKDQVKVYLRAPKRPGRRVFSLRLSGRTRLHGKEVRRPIVPADDLMQAFIYHHLVPARELMVCVLGRPVRRPRPQLAARQRALAKAKAGSAPAGKKKPARKQPPPRAK